MNTDHIQQLHNNKDHTQDKLLLILNESQEHLNRLRRSVNESKKFNKRALKYLVDSKPLLSPELTQRVMNFANNMSISTKDMPEKKDGNRNKDTI